MPCTSSLNFWKSVITSVLLVGVAAGASLVVRPLSLDAWSRGAMCGGVGSVGIGPVAARGFAGGWGFRGISHRAFSCCLWSWPWRVPGLGLWTRLGGANLRVSPLSVMSSSWPRRSKVDGRDRSVLASTEERELCEAAGWFRGLGSTIAWLA